MAGRNKTNFSVLLHFPDRNLCLRLSKDPWELGECQFKFEKRRKTVDSFQPGHFFSSLFVLVAAAVVSVVVVVVAVEDIVVVAATDPEIVYIFLFTNSYFVFFKSS